MATSGLDSKFQDKLTSLKDSADATAKGLVGEGQVAWNTLDDAGPDSPGPDRFTNDYSKEFSRETLQQQYTRANTAGASGSDAKLSDLQLFRFQNDWLAQAERDYLLRRCSRVRSEAHFVSNTRGVGSSKGKLWDGIFRYAKLLLVRAGVTSTTVDPKLTDTRNIA